MLDHPLLRRLITIPAILIAFSLVSIMLPALLWVALLVDLARYLSRGTSAVLARIVVFAWTYLLGEVWAVAALGIVGVLGRDRSRNATYALQAAWASWNIGFLKLVFRIRFVVDGLEATSPSPILVLARHASLIDSLLPALYIANRSGTRLRYVLKKELLLDPALDIAGNRLPNFFIDRKARDSDEELNGIRQLGAALPPSEGLVIFPEGTRFTTEKLARRQASSESRDSVIARAVASYRHVLPPRPAGTLALLDVARCDVVVLVHKGLEGFARVVDVVSGHLVGSTIHVALWRIPAREIPPGRAERVEWLFQVWQDVDDWIFRETELKL